MRTTRRDFLRIAGAAGLAWTLPAYVRAADAGPVLRLGVGADLHQDIVPDAPERLAALIKASIEFKAHAVAQLGDFCQPKAANLPLLKQWRAAGLPQIDVLGNHDMDGGSTADKTVAWMGLKSRYSTQVLAGHRLVVLDGNERRTDRKVTGYPRYIGATQLAWLKSTLAHDTLPVVVLCHQGIDGIAGGIENHAEVRAVLEEANRNAGGSRVRLVLTGHHHLDYLVQVGGIPYLQVNSMSYHWTDKKSAGGRFPAEVEAKYPYLKQVLVYDQPLFALLELTPQGGRVVGRAAKFVGGYGPEQAGIAPAYAGHLIVPCVSDRVILR
jgi:UDP-2,3-diacylglucosamine pyrophosphatase LpxH